MTHTHIPRGFTLLELMVVLVVAGILLGVAVWSMGDVLPGYRTNAAAQRFVLEARNALAVAARANEPVHLVREDGGAGCGAAYRMVQGSDPENPTRVHDTVCMDADYPGVGMDAAGIATAVRCEGDGPATPLPACSFCEEGARLTFYPTGEAVAVAAGGGALASGHSVIFAPERGTDRKTRALAVGVRSGTGRARVYRHAPAATYGWECE